MTARELTGSQWAALWRLPLPGQPPQPKPKHVHRATLQHLVQHAYAEALAGGYRLTEAGHSALVGHLKLRQEKTT